MLCLNALYWSYCYYYYYYFDGMKKIPGYGIEFRTIDLQSQCFSNRTYQIDKLIGNYSLRQPLKRIIWSIIQPAQVISYKKTEVSLNKERMINFFQELFLRNQLDWKDIKLYWNYYSSPDWVLCLPNQTKCVKLIFYSYHPYSSYCFFWWCIYMTDKRVWGKKCQSTCRSG